MLNHSPLGHNVRVQAHKVLTDGIVFIDGLTRTGKSSLSGIIPTLQRSEHIKFASKLEWAIAGRALGLVDLGFYEAYVANYFNEEIHSCALGRNVNFRPSDQSGVAQYCEPDIYYRRLQRSELFTESDFEEIKQRIYPFQTHDILSHIQYLGDLCDSVRIIEMWRNPSAVVTSWLGRGWDKRFGFDPLYFSLTLSAGNVKVPWFAMPYQAMLQDLSPSERCAQLVINLTKQSLRNLKESKCRIINTSLERLSSDPCQELLGIAAFLDSEFSPNWLNKVKEARFPRKTEDWRQKADDLKGRLNQQLFDDLLNLSYDYSHSSGHFQGLFND